METFSKQFTSSDTEVTSFSEIFLTFHFESKIFCNPKPVELFIENLTFSVQFFSQREKRGNAFTEIDFVTRNYKFVT